MNRFTGPLLLLLCTVIWGTAFIAQKLGADHFGPFALTCCRNVMGGLFLLACIRVRDRRRKGATRSATPWKGGLVSGLCLFLAMVSQQLGIEHTTPGVSAFLTANYILAVPVLSCLLGHGRPGLDVCAGVVLALAGTALICLPDFSAALSAFSLGAGEAWTLACAVLFAAQIMVVGRYARETDVLRFSMAQLFAAALFAFPFLFLPSEQARLSWSGAVAGFPALFYVGILSSGIAYTLQNLGQARTPPALAALIMSCESVFGALSGWLFLHDVMTSRQVCGCALVLLAVLLSQVLPLMMRKETEP